MKGYVILSTCVDIPTAEDDGALEAVKTELASKKLFKDAEQAKLEVFSLSRSIVSEIAEENEELDEYEQVEAEIAEDENETTVTTYFQGDMLNVVTYKIEEVEL